MAKKAKKEKINEKITQTVETGGKKIRSLWEDFKKFISRGNVLDMAVGIIIGSAFTAVVTALVNILLSVCTWNVPGGLSGLVTILPALGNSAQAGYNLEVGLGQSFHKDELQNFAIALTNDIYENPTDSLVESVKATILNNYTLHGNLYIYNQAAIIDWGAFINAVISFIIIALTLFVIMKIITALQERRKKLLEKAKEEFIAKHPNWKEETAPEAPNKAPTEIELLTEIRDTLKKMNGELKPDDSPEKN